jgi:hypothetical protein
MKTHQSRVIPSTTTKKDKKEKSKSDFSTVPEFMQA